MKQFYTIILLLGFLQINAQYVFNSTLYIENDIEYKEDNTILVNLTKDYTVTHDYLRIKNYPLKLKDVKDDKEPFIINLEPNITPDNYNSSIFQTYGYRGYQIYFKDGKLIGIVEIIKSYYSDKTRIIKYFP